LRSVPSWSTRTTIVAESLGVGGRGQQQREEHASQGDLDSPSSSGSRGEHMADCGD
jgi:hypothetical protein